MKQESRKIVHVDMDAFYASVEQRDQPKLAGKPIAVGGAGRRGVVMTASYEARKFGVHSAMPSARARRLCPQLIFVPPRFDAYKEASRTIRDVFREFTDLVEPLSLDEAFLDVTTPKQGPPSATLIAKEIKRQVRRRTKLSCSAGVAPNKFLAKIASGFEKPDGLTVIVPSQVEAFVENLPIEKFFGVGPATVKKFHRLGIMTGADLKAMSRPDLVKHFGKAGHWYFRVARGVDNRPVSTSHARKSLSAERTFAEDLASFPDMCEQLDRIAEEVARRLQKTGLHGRRVTLKIKYHDFAISTRSRTIGFNVSSAEDLGTVAKALLGEEVPDRPIRLLGIGLSKLTRKGAIGAQMDLDIR